MLSWLDARRIVIDDLVALRAKGGRRATEVVTLTEAAGRVLAEAAVADRDQPPFHRSTRDGFAVRAADLASVPVRLPVRGTALAGKAFAGTVAAGQCIEIMTGAPLPDGADAVVMIEQTSRPDAGTVEITRAVVAGENVVARASELAAGALAVAAGTRLDHAHLAMLASVGKAKVAVFARPRVAIVPTGDELVAIDAVPGPDQIRNTNAHSLAAQVVRAGGIPVVFDPARDDVADLRRVLGAALREADMLVVTGGVSMGQVDLVEPVLQELGATFRFDAVAVRPGKPTVFGGAQGKPLFGLPGNPLSSMVTFELFVRPAIAVLEGATPAPPLLTRLPLAADYQQRPVPLTVFLAAAVEGEAGDAHARIVASQGSGDLGSMARAQVLVVWPPGLDRVAAGQTVAVMAK